MTGLRKLLSVFLAGTILCIPVAASGSGTVTGSYVYVRSGPGTTYSVLSGCLSGTSVSILGENGNWFNVSVNGISGYMSKSYVSAVTTAAGSYGTVTGTVVNIRSGAGTGYSRIAYAQKGDRLEILESLDGWYKVSAEGKTGYISADYFQPEQINSGAEVTGKVTGGTVNLRSGPGTTYGVVGKVLKDSVLTVLGETGGWYKVGYQTGEAYIIGTYLEVSGSLGENTGPPAADPGTVITGKGVVTGAIVNLRSGPGTNYQIVGQVIKDRAFDVYGETNGWCVVDFNGTKAYISATYINVSPLAAPNTGIVTGSIVNLRSGAGTSFSVVGQVRNGDCVTVEEQSGSWYKITTAASLTGYMSAEYLSVIQSGTDNPPVYSVTPMDKTGKVVGAVTNVRKYPTTDSAVVTVLTKDTAVKITGYVQSGWYRIEYNGYTGYMSGDFVVSEDSTVGTNPGGPAEKTLGEQICDYAMQFIGIPYVYGGSSPSTGFDCSGFTQYVYKHFGYSINRMRQYTEGVPVNKADLKPGDLVFFNTQGTGISHVGMYIGDGQFIHAPTTGKTICITRLDSDYYSTRYVCAVRIV